MVDAHGRVRRLELAREIVEELKYEPPYSHHLVRAIVSNGWVTLEGEVEWHYQKERAEAAARRVEVDANRITVEANGSEVVLKGTVRSWAEREEAERAAWLAPGVRHVDNRISISP